MKPIFGIDITTDKKNTKMNAEEFIIRTTSNACQQNIKTAEKNYEVAEKLEKLPTFLNIIKYACGILGLISVTAIFESGIDIGFAQAYKNASYIIWISFALIIIWLILCFISHKKKKLHKSETNHAISVLDQNIKNSYEDLNIPETASNLDILGFCYKIKNDEPVVKSVGLSITPYINLNSKIFIENNNLCIADAENVYAFSLEKLKSIKTIKKSITLPFWNKEELPNDDKYKEYKIVVNMGFVLVKFYYILELEHNNQTYGIYFPNYELPTIEKITGIIAENNNQK
ncbi:MAG: hypothetical protein E7376_03030 [Clostridiales bacterium]|nr:hypothetical protein [Clostridiales bacterium]